MKSTLNQEHNLNQEELFNHGDDAEQGGISRRRFLRDGTFAFTGVAISPSVLRSLRMSPHQAAKQPVRGGKLRVASAFGGPTDTLDPAKQTDGIDYYRGGALFDALCYFDAEYKLVNALAEEFEPNKDGRVWTIRTRAGVTWHDGKPLTAKDVLYTLKRDNQLQLIGGFATKVIDFANVKVLDKRTLRVPLKVARADWPNDLVAPLTIVQDGATDFSHPVGTGPFEFVSFTPGQTSLFKKNPNYWLSGRPYLDELEISTISDPTSRVNALLSGQVDVIDQMSFESARQYKDTTSFQLVETASGNFIPFAMRVDVAPFNDVRVRQAVRLLADRPKLVDIAQLGIGRVGNDLQGLGQPGYPTKLPQRHQDIAQAKHLLKAAGHDGLTIELNTSALQPGMLEASTAFAQQAKAAGVTIKINNIQPADFYGPKYLKYPFSVSGWGTQPIEQFLAGSLLKGAPYNETHWTDAKFNQLCADARTTFDAAKRAQYFAEAEKILWESGGYVIWGLTPSIDGYGSHVHFPAEARTYELGMFDQYWLD
jgi:peptide/nickel transport system substrate-binding protein